LNKWGAGQFRGPPLLWLGSGGEINDPDAVN
jgi:hypothetical protein